MIAEILSLSLKKRQARAGKLSASTYTGYRDHNITVSAGDRSSKITAIQASAGNAKIHSFAAYAVTTGNPGVEVRASIENASEIIVRLNGAEKVNLKNQTLAQNLYMKTFDVGPGTYATQLRVGNGGGNWDNSETWKVTVSAMNEVLEDVAYITSHNYGVSFKDSTNLWMSIIKLNDGSFVCHSYTEADTTGTSFYVNQALKNEMVDLYEYADENWQEWWFITHPDYHKMASLYKARSDLDATIAAGLAVERGSDEYYAWWLLFAEVDTIEKAEVQIIIDIVITVINVVCIGLLANKARTLSRAQAKNYSSSYINLKPQRLMDELAQSGVKYTKNNVIMVTKTPDGKLMWLETGNADAGLMHIVDGHATHFASRGIETMDIPIFLNNVLKNSPYHTGRNAAGPYAHFTMSGKNYLVAYGDNGFVVNFYPIP